ncbi:MAG: hypothetical protein Q4E86_11220 [Lachnospiraceae bacterium]|nr:hypothetical protein [Lachnospiraceae bacterium]
MGKYQLEREAERFQDTEGIAEPKEGEAVPSFYWENTKGSGTVIEI